MRADSNEKCRSLSFFLSLLTVLAPSGPAGPIDSFRRRGRSTRKIRRRVRAHALDDELRGLPRRHREAQEDLADLRALPATRQRTPEIHPWPAGQRRRGRELDHGGAGAGLSAAAAEGDVRDAGPSTIEHHDVNIWGAEPSPVRTSPTRAWAEERSSRSAFGSAPAAAPPPPSMEYPREYTAPRQLRRTAVAIFG